MWVYLVCVLVLCALWARRRRPPLASGALPLIGHSLWFLKDRAQIHSILAKDIWRDAARRKLSAYTLRFGIFDHYVIIDPDFALLLANTCLKKDKMYTFFEPAFREEGLLTAEESAWRRHRKLLNPTFNQRVLNNYLMEANKHSRQLVEELSTHVGKGPVEHFNIISQYMLHLVITTAIGEYANDDVKLKQQLWHSMETYSNCIIERFLKFWLHNNFIYGLSNLKKRMEAIAHDYIEIFSKITKKRRELLKSKSNEGDRCSVYLDYLLELAEDGVFTDSEVSEELATFVVTASDTTTSALAYVLLNIGSDPRVQHKIQNELHEVFGDSDRDVDKQDIQRLKYTEAVIKETLRLFPPVFMILRELEKDLTFKNYTLPAGSRCMIDIHAILRHEAWGWDAEVFWPERWLATAELPSAHTFAAFGMGKRSCIGGNYAMMLMKTALAHILRHYRVSGDVKKLVQSIDIVVKPAAGCSIEIERRQATKLK